MIALLAGGIYISGGLLAVLLIILLVWLILR